MVLPVPGFVRALPLLTVRLLVLPAKRSRLDILVTPSGTEVESISAIVACEERVCLA